jgi:hypothetical protein
MEVRMPTPKPVSVPQISLPVETHEKAVSPAVIPPIVVVDESTEPAPSRLIALDDHVETIKATYEDKITKLHENYQYVLFMIIFSIQSIFIYLFRAEIRRLTKLLSEVPSRRSSQMAELSELDENIRDIVGDEPSNINPQ